MSAISWDNLVIQKKGKDVEDFLMKVNIPDVISTMNDTFIKEKLFICMKKFEKNENIQLQCIQLLQDCQILTTRGITNEEITNRFDTLVQPLSICIERVDIVTNLFELLAMVADRKSFRSKCTRTDNANDLLSYIGKALEIHRKEKSVQRAGLQLYEVILSNASEKSQRLFAKVMFKAVVTNLTTTNDDPKICYASYSILYTLAENMGDKLAPWVDKILGLLLTTIAQQFSAELVAKCIQLLEKIAVTQESLYAIVAHPRCLLVFTDAIGILEATHMGACITVLEYLLRVLEDESALSVISENLNEKQVAEINYYVEYRKIFHKKTKKYLKLLEESEDIDAAALEYWKQLLEYVMNILNSLLEMDEIVDEDDEDVVQIIPTNQSTSQAIIVDTNMMIADCTIPASYDSNEPLEPILEEEDEENHEIEEIDMKKAPVVNMIESSALDMKATVVNMIESSVIDMKATVIDVKETPAPQIQYEKKEVIVADNVTAPVSVRNKSMTEAEVSETLVSATVVSGAMMSGAVVSGSTEANKSTNSNDIIITWDNIDAQEQAFEVERFLMKADIADCLFTKDKAVIKNSLFLCLQKFGGYPTLKNRVIQLLQDFQVLTPEGITSDELSSSNGFDNLRQVLFQSVTYSDIVIGLLELFSMVTNRQTMINRCINTNFVDFIQQILSKHQKDKSVQRAGLQLYEAVLSNVPTNEQKVFTKIMFKYVVTNLTTTNDDPKICYASYSILHTLAENMGDKLAPWVDKILGLLLTTIAQQFSAELVAKCIQLLEKIAVTQESLYAIVAHPRCLFLFTDAIGILEVRYLHETIIVLEFFLKVLEDETAIAIVFENLKEHNLDELTFFVDIRKQFMEKSNRYMSLLKESSNVTGVVVQGKMDQVVQLIEFINSILTHLLPDDILLHDGTVTQPLEETKIGHDNHNSSKESEESVMDDLNHNPNPNPNPHSHDNVSKSEVLHSSEPLKSSLIDSTALSSSSSVVNGINNDHTVSMLSLLIPPAIMISTTSKEEPTKSIDQDKDMSDDDHDLAKQEEKLELEKTLLLQKETVVEAMKLSTIEKTTLDLEIAKQVGEQERIAIKAQLDLEIAETQAKAEQELLELKLRSDLEVTIAKEKAEKDLIEAKIQAEYELELVKRKSEEEMELMRMKAAALAIEIEYAMEETKQKHFIAKSLAEKEIQDMKDKAEMNRKLAEEQSEAELIAIEEKLEAQVAMLLKKNENISLNDSEMERNKAYKMVEDELLRVNEEEKAVKIAYQSEESSRRKYEIEEENRLLDEEESIRRSFEKELEVSKLLFQTQQEAIMKDLEEQRELARIAIEMERKRILQEAEETAKQIIKEQEIKAKMIALESEEIALRINMEKDLHIKQEEANRMILLQNQIQQDHLLSTFNETEKRNQLLMEQEKTKRLELEIENEKLRITMEEEKLVTQTMIVAMKEATRIQQEELIKEKEYVKKQQEIILKENEKALIEKEKIRVENERLLSEKKAIERHTALEKLAVIKAERERIQQQREIERKDAREKSLAEAEERKKKRMEIEKTAEKERLLVREKLEKERKLAKEKAAELLIQKQIIREKEDQQLLEDRKMKQKLKEETERIAIEETNQRIEAIKLQAKEKAAIKLAMKEKEKLIAIEESQRLADIAKAKINELLLEKEAKLALIHKQQEEIENTVFLSPMIHNSSMIQSNSPLDDDDVEDLMTNNNLMTQSSRIIYDYDDDHHMNNNIKSNTNNNNNTNNNREQKETSFEVIEFETPIKKIQPILPSTSSSTTQASNARGNTSLSMNFSNQWRLGGLKPSANIVFPPTSSLSSVITSSQPQILAAIPPQTHVGDEYARPDNEVKAATLSKASSFAINLQSPNDVDEVQSLYLEALKVVEELKNENSSLKHQLHESDDIYGGRRNSPPRQSSRGVTQHHSSRSLPSSHRKKRNARNTSYRSSPNNTMAYESSIPKSNKIEVVINGLMEAFTQIVLSSSNDSIFIGQSKNELRMQLEQILSDNNDDYIYIFANKLISLFRKLKEDKETLLCTNDNIISLRLMKICLKLLGFMDHCQLQPIDLDIIISQLGVKQLSLYGFVFTLILCAGKCLGHVVFNKHQQYNDDSAEDRLQGFPLFVEVIGIMVDNLLMHLDNERKTILLQQPLPKCKQYNESEEKEVIKLFEREKKALQHIYDIYCPNQLSNNNTFSDTSNIINRNNISVNQTIIGLTFSGIVTLFHDLKLLPSMYSRIQLLSIFHSTLATTTTITHSTQMNSNNISYYTDRGETASKYIFPTSLLHTNIYCLSDIDEEEYKIEFMNMNSSLHILDISNKYYLTFQRFIDFLILASLQCPFFKATDSCVMKASNFLLLLKQITNSEKYLASLKFRTPKEVISFKGSKVPSNTLSTPTNNRKDISKMNSSHQSNLPTTSTSGLFTGGKGLAATQLIGGPGFFSPPSYHSPSEVAPYYDPSTGSIAHGRRRKSMLEFKSKLSDR